MLPSLCVPYLLQLLVQVEVRCDPLALLLYLPIPVVLITKEGACQPLELGQQRRIGVAQRGRGGARSHLKQLV